MNCRRRKPTVSLERAALARRATQNLRKCVALWLPPHLGRFPGLTSPQFVCRPPGYENRYCNTHASGGDTATKLRK